MDVLFLSREHLRDNFKWVLPSAVEPNHFKTEWRMAMEQIQEVVFRDDYTGLEYTIKHH